MGLPVVIGGGSASTLGDVQWNATGCPFELVTGDRINFLVASQPV